MADRTAAPKIMAMSPALCQKCDVCMTCSLSPSSHRLRFSRRAPIGANPEARRSNFERVRTKSLRFKAFGPAERRSTNVACHNDSYNYYIPNKQFRG